MARFTADDTEGYTAADLALLNAAWESLSISTADASDMWAKSMQDHVAERLIFDFDRGLRGADLVAAYDKKES
jgi:hypothetical protein